MAQAIMLREHGGPEVLRLEEVAVGNPPPGMVRIEQTAIGVNFHDCYVRSGLYDTLKLPGIPGLEAVSPLSKIAAAMRSSTLSGMRRTRSSCTSRSLA